MAKKQKSQATARVIDEGYRYWLEVKEAERPEREEEGGEFRIAREGAGFTIDAIARKTGMAWKTVAKFESGEYVQRPKLVKRALWNALKIKQIEIVQVHLPSLTSLKPVHAEENKRPSKPVQPAAKTKPAKQRTLTLVRPQKSRII